MNWQEVHEILKSHSHSAIFHIKKGGGCDLFQRLSQDPALGLSKEEIEEVSEPLLGEYKDLNDYSETFDLRYNTLQFKELKK